MGGNEKYFHAVPDPGGEGETLRLAGVVEGGRGKVWWREGGKRCGGERKIDRVVERGREKMWWREGGREKMWRREGGRRFDGGRSCVGRE